MTRMLFTALVAVTLTLTSCQAVGITDDPKTLNREKAATLIKGDAAFQKTLDLSYELAPANNARVALARHLGYLEADKLVLTEKGRQSWHDLGFQVKSGAVPFAHKELVEVTGISKSGNDADAKFSWRWVPNELGKALVLDSAEFNALPEDLRERIRKPSGSVMIFGGGGSSAISYGGVRSGNANLQQFDDGWRARAVYTF